MSFPTEGVARVISIGVDSKLLKFNLGNLTYYYSSIVKITDFQSVIDCWQKGVLLQE